MEKIEKRNIICLWAIGMLRAAATAFLSVLPAYFLRSGMNDMQISLYNTVAQLVSTSTSLLCAGVASGFRDSRKPLLMLLTIQSVFTGMYALFCAFRVPAGSFYMIMLFICGLLAIVSALTTIFDYKQPYEIMKIESYSVYVAYAGLFSGIIGAIVGVVLPMLFKKFDFYLITGCSIVSAALCLLISALLMYRLKLIGSAKADDAVPSEKIAIHPLLDLKQLAQNKDFLFLVMPNFLRGIGAGIVSMIALIAIRSIGMTDSDTPLLTTAGNIGSMLSSFLYVYFVKRFGVPKTGLIGGCIFCVICLAPFGGSTLFLILYGAAYIGYIVLGNAIPNMVYECADQTIISQFHTWRLAIMAMGTAVGTPICGILLDKIPAALLLLLAAFAILLCMIGYYLCYYKRIKHVST